MRYCTNCGHELGVGRYCTNCGHPVDTPGDDWRTETAERAVVPTPPPPSTPPPPPAGALDPPPPRFPLFADEAPQAFDAPEAAATAATPVAAAPPPPTSHRSRGPWWPWALTGVVLLVVLLIGIRLLGEDDTDATGSSGRPESSATSSTEPQPSDDEPSESESTDDPLRDATVTVPATAPPGLDSAGNRTTYVGANMLDGDPATAWRMGGDGTGREIVVTLSEESHLRTVGLINGYAKTAVGAGGGTIDWYRGNRRIEKVEWAFDDGTTITQDLTDTNEVQSVDVDVTTSTVTLRLLAVSAPGRGPNGRNFTAVSELSVGTD